jgi:hypothetical protein
MNWIPAITSTGLLAVVLWLLRNLISTRLKSSVRHEFDEKLEDVRSEHRKQESHIRAELQAREAELAALRSTVMSGMSGRQVEIDKRKLHAIDQLWDSVVTLAPARALAANLSVLNIDAVADRVQRDQKVQQFIEMLGLGIDAKQIDYVSASKARPFISPMVWATYSALQAVAGHALLQWHAIKNGLDPKGLVDEQKVTTLIKTALPNFSDILDKYGSRAWFHTLEPLENQLIVEVQRMLAGKDDDKARLERAAEILKQSNEVMRDNARSATAA